MEKWIEIDVCIEKTGHFERQVVTSAMNVAGKGALIRVTTVSDGIICSESSLFVEGIEVTEKGVYDLK